MIDYADFASHLRDREIEESACIFLVVSSSVSLGLNLPPGSQPLSLVFRTTSFRMLRRGLDLLASSPSPLACSSWMSKHNQSASSGHLLQVGAQSEHRSLKVCLTALGPILSISFASS